MTTTEHEAIIRALAADQHGVVTRVQLIAAGVPVHSIDYRVKRGGLHRLYRGLYRAGPLPARCEREMAAVLACGEGAVLSHRSAGALWRLLPDRLGRSPVEVTITHGYRLRRCKDARAYRTVTLAAEDRTQLEGIPITTAARTLLDMASVLPVRKLEHALARGLRRGLADPDEVARLAGRFSGRPGSRVLRDLVVQDGGIDRSRSEAEARFRSLVSRAQLPRPRANVNVVGHEVDFFWSSERVVVEVDGFQFHASAKAFEEDRQRDAELAAEGFQVMRVTWRQLTEEPEALLVRLTRVLAQARKR